MAQLIIGGLALVGIGTAGYRAYKLKQIAKEEEQARNIIEIEVESTEEKTRN